MKTRGDGPGATAAGQSAGYGEEAVKNSFHALGQPVACEASVAVDTARPAGWTAKESGKRTGRASPRDAVVGTVVVGRFPAAGRQKSRVLVPPEIAPDDPASLVARIVRGDRRGEDDLIRRYRRGVLAVLSGARRDAAAIDDLYQETFRIAIEKIRAGALREPEKLSGFLCGLARNLAIEHFRRAARRPVSALPDDATLASGAPGPLDDLLRSERAAIARRVLSELPTERDRAILFRFYVAEEDKERICVDLGLASLHFNRILFRARERYRALYTKATASNAAGNASRRRAGVPPQDRRFSALRVSSELQNALRRATSRRR